MIIGLALLLAVTRSDAPQISPNLGQEKVACVISAGDLNGDGVPDFAASFPSDRQMPVYIIFGGGEPLPAIVDREYLKEHAAFVIRGAKAAPFGCTEDNRNAGLTTRQATSSVAKRRAVAASPVGRPPAYTVVDIDPLMPGFTDGFSSAANAINAEGGIVGGFFTAQGEHAFAYENGVVRDLGTLGGHISDARDINDDGLIVGFSLTGEVDDSGFVSDAFLHAGNVMKDLGLRWSSAEGISNAGRVVGEMRVQPNADLSHAFVYDQGITADLGTLPPLGTSAHSVALAINDSGKVVGESDTFVFGKVNPSVRYFARHAFAYENGVMTDLGSLGPVCAPFPGGGERCSDQSIATDVNNAGHLVGFSMTATGPHAFVQTGVGLQDLGTLGGNGSWAYGINDSGQIVGSSLDAQERYAPFLYDQGTLYDLNSLIVNSSEVLPFSAYAINNFGQIVGNHHVLNPVYDALAPGQKLSFDMTFGKALSFEYWLARGDLTGCNAASNRLRFQIKVDLKDQRNEWVLIGNIAGCEKSTDWKTISLNIPTQLQQVSARVHIRVREDGASTAPVVYLRHFANGPATDR